MKKILVTGANGQLGRSIKNIEDKLQDTELIYTDVDELDLLNYDKVERFIKEEKPDFIINCAAYTAVDNAEEDKENAANLNARVPKKLGEISKANNIKIIHVSTDYVFDGESNIPYTEKDEANPVTVYGKTKLDGENLLLSSNPDAMVIRTSWLYSAYGKNFMKTIIKLASERDKLTVVFDQIGTPTYSGQLADAILHVINKYYSEKKWFSGIYHFSNQGVCSWYDFAYEILKLNDIKCELKAVSSDKFPTKAKRPAFSVLDKSSFESDLEYNIKHWTEGLKECLDIFNMPDK